MIFLLLLRFLHFYVYLQIAENADDFYSLDLIAFLNTFIFAIFNGTCTTGFFSLSSKIVDDSWKERVGFLNGFSLTFGILSGIWLALIFKN